MPLPAKPDQLGSAGYSSQRSCRESLCQAECTKGHSPGNSGGRLPSYCPFMQLYICNGLLWKCLRKAKRDATFKRGKKNTTAVAWHRPGVQRPTFLDWQRPATYKSSQASLFTKAEEAYLGGTAADGCGMSKYTDKKQKWPNRNSHRNPNLWLQCCTAEVKTMAGCSYWDL